jgi:hypothetical protein
MSLLLHPGDLGLTDWIFLLIAGLIVLLIPLAVVVGLFWIILKVSAGSSPEPGPPSIIAKE